MNAIVVISYQQIIILKYFIQIENTVASLFLMLIDFKIL